jgi:hypothetical protein
VITLYALVDHPGSPLLTLGELSAVPLDGLAFVCGPAGDPGASAERLWEHERVVEGLMEERDLLPVRYGTRLRDESDAVRALEERHDELAAALGRVRGAVELSLRVLGEQEADTAQAVEIRSGADYMRAKARAASAHAEVARAVHEPLAVLSRATVERPPRIAGELLRAAYLVERSAVDGFVRQVAALQEAQPGLQLLCTGPWPAYSFSAA